MDDSPVRGQEPGRGLVRIQPEPQILLQTKKLETMETHKLLNFIDEQYLKASKINHFSAYISWSDKKILIKQAKYYRKLIIQNVTPAFRIHCKDEELGKLIWVNITKNHSLIEVILILIAQNFYMTLQQTKEFKKV